MFEHVSRYLLGDLDRNALRTRLLERFEKLVADVELLLLRLDALPLLEERCRDLNRIIVMNFLV